MRADLLWALAGAGLLLVLGVVWWLARRGSGATRPAAPPAPALARREVQRDEQPPQRPTQRSTARPGTGPVDRAGPGPAKLDPGGAAAQRAAATQALTQASRRAGAGSTSSTSSARRASSASNVDSERLDAGRQAPPPPHRPRESRTAPLPGPAQRPAPAPAAAVPADAPATPTRPAPPPAVPAALHGVGAGAGPSPSPSLGSAANAANASKATNATHPPAAGPTLTPTAPPIAPAPVAGALPQPAPSALTPVAPPQPAAPTQTHFAPPAPPAPRGPATVLVVDDSKVVRIKTSRLLEKNHYRVLLADDGLSALQCVAEQWPDLVITDVEMPGLDGFGLTQRLREFARGPALPVLMITSSNDKHRDAAVRAGVNMLLGKPYAEDVLLAEVEKALGRMAPVAAPGMALQ